MLLKEEYVKDLKAKLDELNTGIKKIELKVKSINEKGKAKLQARIKVLREKRDSAFSKIQELKDTGEDAWQDLKQGTENVIHSLQTALSNTLSHFKKKKVTESLE